MTYRSSIRIVAGVVLLAVAAVGLRQVAHSQPVITLSAPAAPQAGGGEHFVSVGQIGGAVDTVARQGDYLYTGRGPRLEIWDVSDPLNPSLSGQTQVLPGIVYNVTLAGNYAYVATGYGGWQIVDVADPAAPTIVAVRSFDGYVRDVAVDGRYAYVAVSDGLYIFDAINPAAPVQVGFISRPGARRIAVGDGLASVVAAGLVVIVDVTNPTAPQQLAEIGIVFTPFLDAALAGNLLFIAADSMSDGGLLVYDISDPAQPAQIGEYAGVNAATHLSLYDVPGGPTPDRVYLSSADGLRILDVADPTNPTLIGSELSYGAGENIRLGDYAYVVTTSGVTILDVSNEANPQEIWISPPPSYAWEVAVQGDYAYIASTGLRIVDVADPKAPVLVGAIESPNITVDLAIEGNYVYVAERYAGLRVIDVTSPTNPLEVGAYITPTLQPFSSIDVAGDYAYLGKWYDAGLLILDVSNPAAITFASTLPSSYVLDVDATGDYVYLTTGSNLRVIDVTNPTSPFEVESYPPPPDSAFYAIQVVGDYAYVAGKDGLYILDVSDPTSIDQLAFYPDGNNTNVIRDVVVSGNRAFLTAPFEHLEVFDVSDPTTPVLLDRSVIPLGASYIDVANGRVYTASEGGGMFILGPGLAFYLPLVAR